MQTGLAVPAAVFSQEGFSHEGGALQAARDAAALKHQLLGLSAAVLLLVAQCAVFVYFLGTGKAIKTAVEMRGLDAVLARKTRTLKGKTFPFATFAALAVVTAAVLAGASEPRTHAIAMCVALGMNLLAIPFELRSIRENAQLMDATDTALTTRETEIVSKGESLADPDAAPPVFVLGRLLLLAGGSVWLVFAYQALVMRGHPEPWPWYVVASGVSLLLGFPLLMAGRKPTQPV